MKYTKPLIHDEGLPFPTDEVGNYSRILNIFNGSIKDTCVDMVNVHVFVNESSHSSGTKLIRKNGSIQGHEFRGNSEFMQYHKETDIGTFWRDSEWKCDWKYISIMDEMSHDQVIQWAEAEVRVYSDSVLCQGKMWAQRDAIIRWKVEWKNSKCPLSCIEFLGIVGEAIEFEWHIFPGFSSLQIIQERSRMICENGSSNLKNSQIESSSCQCSTILSGQEKETMTNAKKSCKETGRSSVLETKRSGMEKQSTLLKESGIQ